MKYLQNTDAPVIHNIVSHLSLPELESMAITSRDLNKIVTHNDIYFPVFKRQAAYYHLSWLTKHERKPKRPKRYWFDKVHQIIHPLRQQLALQRAIHANIMATEKMAITLFCLCSPFIPISLAGFMLSPAVFTLKMAANILSSIDYTSQFKLTRTLDQCACNLFLLTFSINTISITIIISIVVLMRIIQPALITAIKMMSQTAIGRRWLQHWFKQEGRPKIYDILEIAHNINTPRSV